MFPYASWPVNADGNSWRVGGFPTNSWLVFIDGSSWKVIFPSSSIFREVSPGISSRQAPDASSGLLQSLLICFSRLSRPFLRHEIVMVAIRTNDPMTTPAITPVLPDLNVELAGAWVAWDGAGVEEDEEKLKLLIAGSVCKNIAWSSVPLKPPAGVLIFALPEELQGVSHVVIHNVIRVNRTYSPPITALMFLWTL